MLKLKKNKTIFKNIFFIFLIIALIFLLFISPKIQTEMNEESVNHDIYLWMAIIILFGTIGSIVEKFKQPSVLGEILIGIFLGNLTLIGINFFVPIIENSIMLFLAELGVIILLFQTGLESNITDLLKVGPDALKVGIIGVLIPLIFGTLLISPFLFPGISFNTHLFIAAALTATSIGITARVLKDLHKTKTKEAKIILGAAVVDDVLGLIILAILSSLVTKGNIDNISIVLIIFKSLFFSIGSIIFGQLSAKYIGKLLSSINPGHGTKLIFAAFFGLSFSYFAVLLDLEPILGAFAAGLVLENVYFKHFEKPKMIKEIERVFPSDETECKFRHKIKGVCDAHSKKHIDDLIAPFSYFFVPIFFIMIGMQIDLSGMSWKIFFIALALGLFAILSKFVSGFFVKKGNKLIVGAGMIPRGEVGIIFAAIGLHLDVFSKEIFTTLIITIMITTIITPPLLSYLFNSKKNNPQEKIISGGEHSKNE